MRGLALALSLLVVLGATLVPGAPTDPSYRLFATRWLADALLNVVLFVPLGASLATFRRSVPRMLLAAAAVSAAIEAMQALIPGRDPSPIDLVANTVGAAIGVLVVRAAPRWLRPSRPTAGPLAIVAAAIATGVVAATGTLLAPSLPHSVYYGQWTPNLGHLEWYRGRVLSAALAGIPLPSQRLEGSEHVRGLLLEGAPLEVRAIAGPAPSRLSSLFSVYDEVRQEIVLLGPVGADLAVRLRVRAVPAGLAAPPLYWRNALSGVRTGDTLAVRLRSQAGGRCLTVNGRASCGMRYRAGVGWALLLHVDALSQRSELLLGGLWLIALAAPAGFWVRRSWSGLAAALVVVCGPLAAAPAVGLAPLSLWETGALAGGCVIGAALAALARSPNRVGDGKTH